LTTKNCPRIARRDAVTPAESSASTQAKKISPLTADGLPVQSFHTHLRSLAMRCRATCRIPSDPSGATFQQLTEARSLRACALQLLGL
jgi:hypothetical protein